MTQSFDLIFSDAISIEELHIAIAELIPAHLLITVTSGLNETPEDFGGFWGDVVETSDSEWPICLSVMHCHDSCEIGDYPDLKIAEQIWKKFGVNSLCGIYPSVGGLDPSDPYWSTGFINGKWYLVSTADTKLMGPYTDGRKSYVGSSPVRVVREIQAPW